MVRLPLDVAIPPAAELERELRRYLMRELCGWLQLVVVELLMSGCVEWSANLLADPGRAGAQLLTVRCVDRPGPRRPGLWAALSVAHALAHVLGGEVIDPVRRVGKLRPPADGRVRAVEHLGLPSSRDARGRRSIGTVGMAQFGLAELELACVPAADVEQAAALLLGVAQHLIDASSATPRPREVLLTVAELFWALGGDAQAVPISHGRGWTRVGLDAGPGAVLRLRPPVGTRSWRGGGAWVRDAHFDLYGPPHGASSCRQK